jgi:UDP-glucuronate decarboxylase
VQALQNKPITLNGDGSQTRSCCYVDDMVDGLLKLMASADEITGPINIGNDSEFTIRELAETVIELTNSRSKIVTNPLPPDDPRQRKPDISLARETLGWSATTPLEIGLAKTVAYFERLLKSDGDKSISSLARAAVP